jgi:hypothetical protein
MRTHELMRQSRERKSLSIAALAERAGLREPLVQVIERGAFDELPSGLYGRSAVRAYAKAVGLNPDEILDAVSGQLRMPEDPLEGLVRVHGLRPRPKRDAVKSDVRREAVALPYWQAISIDDEDWRVAAASAIDGALIIFVSVILLQLTATAARTPVADVMHGAAFVLLGGVRNATFGSTLAGARAPGRIDRIDASGVVRRAAECALREGSIVVEWICHRRRYTVSVPDLNATGRPSGFSAIR